ncbi:lipopolysaccharide biosynthesis protein, partial [Candidatus Omnitrophota bacterium]
VMRVGLRFSRKLCIDMLKYSLPLLPSDIARTLVNASDRFILKHYMTLADVGIYSLARKFGAMLHMLVTSPFIQTFLPRRFELVKRDNARELFSKIFDYYSFLVICIAFAIALFGKEILYVMTTEKYYPAAQLIPLSVLCMVVFGFRYHFDFGMLYKKKTLLYSKINILSSIINITLNLVLIKKYGAFGALYALLLTRIVNTACFYFANQRIYCISFNIMRVLSVLSIAIIVYSGSTFIGEYVPLTILIGTKMVIYLVFVWGAMLLMKFEVKNLKAFFVKNEAEKTC